MSSLGNTAPSSDHGGHAALPVAPEGPGLSGSRTGERDKVLSGTPAPNPFDSLLSAQKAVPIRAAYGSKLI